ncbi:cytochrome b561 [Methylobacterium persicinum]|uniref:Cytochrome b561 n=1 Tax=Methylobacterium persicinum TaxID=374426 RepID=A0ABU0HM69_9HYPH|nr:cytochrome b561 [Methylobacterium persicinum]GJE37808.1 hypothetical protein KHHGKMAE_1870 [Methylobacterium persicinum]
MARWIPVVATLGLLCVMILPTPGILGVIIGASCVVVIGISVMLFVLDRIATRILNWRPRWRRYQTIKVRNVHSNSGMARK